MGVKDFYNTSNISDAFGAPRDGGNHTGTDFALPEGTPIPAIMPGTVSANSSDDRYGNYLDVKVGDKTVRYAHMRERSPLSTGAKVVIGQIVGNVGATGFVTGPHLHLEIRTAGGGFQDPMPTVQDILSRSDAAIEQINGVINGTIFGTDNIVKSVGNLLIPDSVSDAVNGAKNAANALGDVGKYGADLVKWLLTERHWWAIAFGAGGIAMMGLGASIYFRDDIISATPAGAALKAIK